MLLRIERVKPRPGGKEVPTRTTRGYELANRRLGGKSNKVARATFVHSLEEAARLVEKGFSIRMGGPGKRPSLISPGSLRIVRA